jgi:hypothetical protein
VGASVPMNCRKDEKAIKELMLTLSRKEFCKSMTSNCN